jgi:hypothetical protein
VERRIVEEFETEVAAREQRPLALEQV